MAGDVEKEKEMDDILLLDTSLLLFRYTHTNVRLGTEHLGVGSLLYGQTCMLHCTKRFSSYFQDMPKGHGARSNLILLSAWSMGDCALSWIVQYIEICLMGRRALPTLHYTVYLGA